MIHRLSDRLLLSELTVMTILERKQLTFMFPPARSKLAMTPSRDSLMCRTPSSSFRNAASGSTGSVRSVCCGPVGVLGVLGVRGVFGRIAGVVLEGDAQISVVSVVSASSAIMYKVCWPSRC